MSKSSLQAAAEAAAKVNAMLVAKGKLKLSATQVKPKIGNAVGGNRANELITAEVDINDALLSARNLLTRGHMQDEICKVSGAAISTRGRYMTPEERQTIASPECRPLYLNIQASSYESVRIAVQHIRDILDKEMALHGLPKSPTVGVVTFPGGTNATPVLQPTHFSSGSHFVQDKVFIGLEQAPSNYPVRDKILGPGGSFLQHIRTETGATITLRGKGSGFIEPTSGQEAFEPLYIYIMHPKAEGLQAAKALAINLVETAHVEFATWQQQQQTLPLILPTFQNQVVLTPGRTGMGMQISTTSADPQFSPTLLSPLPLQGAVISYPTFPVVQRQSIPQASHTPRDVRFSYPSQRYYHPRNCISQRNDSDLMPPPSLQREKIAARSTIEGHNRKKLKGALGGIASVYGSDSSDDEDYIQSAKWPPT